MGLTLQFAVGQKETIISAVEKEDFEFLEKLDVESNIADLSFHLEPNDLNLLVTAATELLKVNPTGLREHLDFDEHFFDAADRGAVYVHPNIPLLFAALETRDSEDLANRWFLALSSQYNEEIKVTPELIGAIKQLITICKKTNEQNQDLVHIWFA